VVGDPPPPPEGAVAELPFDLRTTRTSPARPAPVPAPRPGRPAVRATSSTGEPGPYVHALEHGESPPSYAGHDHVSSEQRHEGFVFRVASGASYLLGNLSARASTCAECSEVESLIGTLRGAVVDTEVVLGGTLSPGVVMGLRGTVSVPPRPSFEPSPEGGEGLAPAPFALGTVGLVFDWYPDPGGGFHMLFAPGAAFARIRDEEQRMPSELLRGMVVATALGWEGWVSESWSFGLEATGELGYLVTETSASFGYVAPGARVTLTYD
ncbi:MAG: hypothetical protein IT373_07175, partial [Polyangiaceae bacterium]|nr:hypothetical protein [Polyangiaceae bacterium]